MATQTETPSLAPLTSNAAALPANTGTEHHYRIVYFKYDRCVQLQDGAAPWATLTEPSFRTAQVIDLPQNFDLRSYGARECPALVRDHVAQWLARSNTYLPQPRQAYRRDWELVCRLQGREEYRRCYFGGKFSHVVVRVLLRAPGESPETVVLPPPPYDREHRRSSWWKCWKRS